MSLDPLCPPDCITRIYIAEPPRYFVDHAPMPLALPYARMCAAPEPRPAFTSRIRARRTLA